jgi:hypothetical protein
VGSDGNVVLKKQYAVAAALAVMMGEHGEGARVFGRLWHGRVGKTNPHVLCFCFFFLFKEKFCLSVFPTPPMP